MAYNNKNYWKRIVDIQEWVLELQENNEDIKLKTIHKNYIYPKYRISYKTFSNYLGIPAKRNLKKYEETQNNQTKLEL